MFVYAIILAGDKMKKENQENKLTEEYVEKLENNIDEAHLAYIKLFADKLKADLNFIKLKSDLREKEKQRRTLGFLAITFGVILIVANVIFIFGHK